MAGLLVGAGGWAYFRVPGMDNLSAYSQAFDFVEVNSTFYQLPSLLLASGWRTRVHRNFRFSLRCPREIVDRYGLKLESKGRRVMERVKEMLETLEAPILTILISRNSPIPEDDLEVRLEEFLKTFHSDTVRVAVEFRDRIPSKDLFRVMKENGAVHCVDLSTQEPEYEGRLVYSRLFGKGKDNIYEFDDNELREITTKASEPKIEKSILAFHGVRMYRDAARIKTFLEKGYFPRITSDVGINSIREVLKEDVRFPTTRGEMIERQGWKLFDKNSGETQRMQTVLEKLPEGKYGSVQEVILSIRNHTDLA